MADGFLEAAKDGDIELTRQYIKAGIDVNGRSAADGTTALYWAACAGNVPICKLLLDSGADVNAVCNQWGSRPLHAAADRGHTDCVFILISGGADVNLTCLGRHETALHKAAYRGHYHVCRLLLDRGAHTDVINEEGKTAMQEAQNGRHYDVYQLILAYEKGFQRLKKPATELMISDAKRSKTPGHISAPLTAMPASRMASGHGSGTPSEVKDDGWAARTEGGLSDDSGSRRIQINGDSNPDHSGTAAKYHDLSRKYQKMERCIEKLMTLLEKNQLKLSAAEAKNEQLKVELRATKQQLEATENRLQVTANDLRATRKALRATESELRATESELRATRAELARLDQREEQTVGSHRILAVCQNVDQPLSRYRSSSVLDPSPSDVTLTTAARDDGHQLYSLLRHVLETAEQPLVRAFSSMVHQATSEWRVELCPLDTPQKAWRVGVDYHVDSAAVLPAATSAIRTAGQCTLVIRRQGKLYELKVYRPRNIGTELRRRCHGYSKLPGHNNINLPVHVFELEPDSPPIFAPVQVQCLVYPLITTRLTDLPDLARRGRAAVTWSESFFRYLLYGLLSGLTYLHQHHVPHKPVTCRDVYLNRDLMPVITCLDPNCTPDGAMEVYVSASTKQSLPLPPEVESIRSTWSQIQEKDKETLMTQLSDKAEVFLLGRVIINVIFRWYGTLAQNPEPGYPDIAEGLSRDLRQLILDMIHPKPEERISAEMGKIRLGLMMFGPKPDDVQTMASYQIWHQVELMKLLMSCQQKGCTEINSSGEYTRTIPSSLRHNDVILRRDFLTSVPLDKQWDVYRTFNSSNKQET